MADKEATTIGDAVARLEAQSFVGRERELRQFARWLTSPEPMPAILNVSGPGGVGKSALLHAFRRAAADEGRRVRWVDGYSIAPEPEAFVAALGDGDADADADAVLAEINETKPLVVLDTFERLGALAAYFTDEFLPALELGVKVVVSGRLPIGRAWSRNIPWHQVIQPMPLAALTPPDTTEFLARRGIAESTLVEQIMRATGGQPLALSMAVDLVEQFGVRDFAAAPEWRLRLRSLVERMLSDVSDPLLRTLLDACAVVRHFDEPMLAAVSGIDDISSAFDQLCRLSIVRPSDHGLMLHEDVRRILAEDLRWRQPDRYRRLELRCFEYYGQRVRTVGRAEREWLVAERLYLWGDDFAHMMLFAEDEPGDMWVVPGTDNDADELWPVVKSWLRGGLGGEVEINFDDYPLEDAKAFTEALLSHPHRRVRVTRDRDGTALGFSTVMPITRSSFALLSPHPIVGPVLNAYLDRDEVERPPERPEDARVFQFVQLAYGDTRPSAVRAALMREMFGLFALSGVYLIELPIPSWKRLFEALGFRRLDGASHSVWSGPIPTDGYVLDISRVGGEAWIEALVAGRPLPWALKAAELAEELRVVLTSWHDDAPLARSLLVHLTRVGGDAAENERASAVRDLVRDALDRVRSVATPDVALAYRALELAYLEKRANHERVAEQISVSRTQFYRLIKRATSGLVEALAQG